MEYSPARRSDTVREYHGEKVPAPYDWLEKIGSAETRTWLATEKKLTDAWLAKLPERAALLKRLRETTDYEKEGAPRLNGGRLFYGRRTGLERQARYLWREDREGAEEKELFNPNEWSKDGTVALAKVNVNDQGTLAAYGKSSAGSDWTEWKIRRVDTGEDLPETLTGVKFSQAAWKADGKSFFYGRYQLPKEGEEFSAVNENQRIFHHVAGTPQAEDTLVYEDKEQPRLDSTVFQSEDGEIDVLARFQGAAGASAWSWRPASSALDAPFRPLTPEFTSRFAFVGHEDGEAIFLTDHGAPKQRLVAIPLDDPREKNWRTLIPEGDDMILDVSLTGNRYVVERLHDASSRVTFYSLEGEDEGDLELPSFVSAGGFHGRRNQRKTFFTVTGYTIPSRVMELDLESKKARPFWSPKLPFHPEDFETEQLFCASKDGTRVPMFLVKPRGAKPDRPRPLILTGYGGFQTSLTPAFSNTKIPWLERDALHVTVNLRGGGEYGKEWHRQGSRGNKQNVFDDFIAAAEYLIREGWTDRAHLAITGGSNGGLLIGAVLNQRPDLFAAAAPAVGVMDMLRYDKFTIGWAWTSEYGDPAESPEMFRSLLAYSPLHNIREKGGYPPVLIMTGDHDDRVFPAHSFKYAAALQRVQKGGAPALLRVESKAGHGAGKPLDKALEQEADLYSFFLWAMSQGE